jgi:putative ABC transport system ATP-binding protein
MAELMRFESLEYQYANNSKPALKHINLSVEEGDYLAIIGTSGSGKSTLMSIMGLINPPTRGRYYLLDTDVTRITEDSKAKLKNQEIGLIFQSFNLLGHLTIYQNVCLPLHYASNVPRSTYQEKVLDALSQVNMEAYLDRYPNQLSGGQQQRVAIARAIVNNPTLILADEPTGNLDSANAKSVFAILETLNLAGKTICLITHDHQFAMKAKRQIFIRDGQILETQQEAVSEKAIA